MLVLITGSVKALRLVLFAASVAKLSIDRKKLFIFGLVDTQRHIVSYGSIYLGYFRAHKDGTTLICYSLWIQVIGRWDFVRLIIPREAGSNGIHFLYRCQINKMVSVSIPPDKSSTNMLNTYSKFPQLSCVVDILVCYGDIDQDNNCLLWLFVVVFVVDNKCPAPDCGSLGGHRSLFLKYPPENLSLLSV